MSRPVLPLAAVLAITLTGCTVPGLGGTRADACQKVNTFTTAGNTVSIGAFTFQETSITYEIQNIGHSQVILDSITVTDASGSVVGRTALNRTVGIGATTTVSTEVESITGCTRYDITISYQRPPLGPQNVSGQLRSRPGR